MGHRDDDLFQQNHRGIVFMTSLFELYLFKVKKDLVLLCQLIYLSRPRMTEVLFMLMIGYIQYDYDWQILWRYDSYHHRTTR